MAKFPVSVVKVVKDELKSKVMDSEKELKFWETFYRIVKARKSKVLIISLLISILAFIIITDFSLLSEMVIEHYSIFILIWMLFLFLPFLLELVFSIGLFFLEPFYIWGGKNLIDNITLMLGIEDKTVKEKPATPDATVPPGT